MSRTTWLIGFLLYSRSFKSPAAAGIAAAAGRREL
jgi:hypothetical protein